MFGTLSGNIGAICFFCFFQILGILLSLKLLKRQSFWFTVLIGSVLGSFSLQWLPVLYAFFIDFTVLAHVLALITMALIVLAAYVRIPGNPFKRVAVSIKDPALFVILPLYLLTVIILTGHTIPYIDGAMHSGQSTYGDMNMHLGFITSIAKQSVFPPEYSILPGTRLAYPFLSDSISSSLYLFGCSLRIAYLISMYVALLQVFFGVYCIAKQSLFVLNKPHLGKSILAFVLFFLNGGFGFYYFVNEGFASENFKRIFTAFYETPTNYVQENIQWHNILCDMLIPQRATLFGWAILFPLLALLLKARKEADSHAFILCGILAGGLVLIHTHSFLALGVLCAIFVLQDLTQEETGKSDDKKSLIARLCLVVVFLSSMSILCHRQHSQNPLSSNLILSFGIGIVAAFLGWLCWELVTAGKNGTLKKILRTWGLFLLVVVILALPQLIGFTFRQAQGDQFVRGSFNWANESDEYILFYLKNLGIMFILTILTLIFGTKKQIRILSPACFLWVICEFILFQPNPYDNNKLLLVSYLFMCIAVSDFVWDTIPALGKKKSSVRILRITSVACVTVLGVFAAVLTVSREYVSDYELYSRGYVKMCEWVENNTNPTDTFLTATNHNNAIASLTGRNIVCGSGSFLYYHGVDYAQNEADVKTMYEDPSRRDALLDQYHVDYLVLGPCEWGTYEISDIEEMYEKYDVVYNEENVVVLRHVTR